MKIVDLQTFLALPPNTLFAKYTPYAFERLAIKAESCENDFFLSENLSSAIKNTGFNEFVELLDRALETGTSIETDFDTLQRDGCFEADQLFAVWEPADLKLLIERLTHCLDTVTGI